jgi:hypothetical protein
MNVSIEQHMKAAIDAAIERGWTLNGIALAAGVPHSALHGFIHGDPRHGRPRALRIPHVDKLCEFFGMRLTKPKIPRPPERGGK